PVDGELTASFDGRVVTYGFGELDMLVPAYAATIHKSQGSEYPAVVIRDDATLPDAAAEPALHRCYARQEAGRARRAEEGRRHRCPQRLRPTTVVKAAGVAPPVPSCFTAVAEPASHSANNTIAPITRVACAVRSL